VPGPGQRLITIVRGKPMDENNENVEEVQGGETMESSETAEASAGAGQQPPRETTKEARMWAMLAHLLGLFTCFVGPLIIWLVKKEEDAFVDNQGKEALNFQITVALAMVVSGLLSVVCIGIILGAVVAVGDLVFCILACVKSNAGEAYRYPVSIRFIK
jgi:uncharacterized Tic20 family protein